MQINITFFLILSIIISGTITVSVLIKNKKLIQENSSIKIDVYDKNISLKEANHRLKNNLQLINSLLSYQAKEYKNQDVNNFLLKGQKRINSIILLHENFDITKSNNEINLKKYIEDLFDFFTDLFEIEKKAIQFQLNTNDITIDIETALPLGIILNELISNSLLHAFPSNRKDNVISITIKRLEKDTYKLFYEDNGIGFLYKSKEGLGLKIVELLSNQINGEYFFDSTDGFNFILSFKVNN